MPAVANGSKIVKLKAGIARLVSGRVILSFIYDLIPAIF
jgi:hypothetical protein